jgi:hypothetical protein
VNAGERLRATYDFRPVDHLVRREFYIWDEAIARWKTEGLPDGYRERNLFNFDPSGQAPVGLNLGWCEPPFRPVYEEKIVRDEGRTEIIQDWAGRHLRVFKGRRHGFMPDYVRHPVSSWKDWEEDVATRLDPAAPSRYEGLEEKCRAAEERRRAESAMVGQGMVGGYMYLRALVGPEDLLYAFCDKPDLVHAMMQRWEEVMDAGLERVQRQIELDELAIGEDICYNHGLLISPDMVREFLLPHYQTVVGRARKRQNRKLYFHVDTDGWAVPAVPLYLEAGMDAMSPWEVASGCDVVDIGRCWPELVMAGGIDKRVLAAGREAIDRHLEHVIPAMRERGGYIPTCDHGVPDNVSLESYLHYRRRICELDHV